MQQNQSQLELILKASKAQHPEIDAVVLACTELSVLVRKNQLLGLNIVDPLKLSADWLCSHSFEP